MNPTPPSTTILFCIFFPFTGEKAKSIPYRRQSGRKPTRGRKIRSLELLSRFQAAARGGPLEGQLRAGLRRAELRPADSPEANRKSSGRDCQKPLLSLSVVFDVGLFCEKRLRELVDAVYRDYLDAFGTLAAFGQIARHDDAPESAIHSIRGVLRPAFQMAVDDDLIRKNPFGFELASVVVKPPKSF